VAAGTISGQLSTRTCHMLPVSSNHLSLCLSLTTAPHSRCCCCCCSSMAVAIATQWHYWQLLLQRLLSFGWSVCYMQSATRRLFFMPRLPLHQQREKQQQTKATTTTSNMHIRVCCFVVDLDTVSWFIFNSLRLICASIRQRQRWRWSLPMEVIVVVAV